MKDYVAPYTDTLANPDIHLPRLYYISLYNVINVLSILAVRYSILATV